MKISLKTKQLLLATALGTLMSFETQAASINYILDQSNIETILPDGVSYLTVTIQDGLTFGTDTNAVKFIVDVIDSVFTSGGISKGNNFGIRDFGFNLAAGAPTVADSNIVGPSGWSGNIVPPNNQLDGFGRFTADIKGTGQNRFDPLVFWITGVIGDTITSYAAPSSNPGNSPNPAAQGNAWFAAHVGDFKVNGSTINDGYFGGGTSTTPPPVAPVPLPAALWLFMSALTGGYLSSRKKKTN
jgi:hypothetical protein